MLKGCSFIQAGLRTPPHKCHTPKCTNVVKQPFHLLCQTALSLKGSEDQSSYQPTRFYILFCHGSFIGNIFSLYYFALP